MIKYRLLLSEASFHFGNFQYLEGVGGEHSCNHLVLPFALLFHENCKQDVSRENSRTPSKNFSNLHEWFESPWSKVLKQDVTRIVFNQMGKNLLDFTVSLSNLKGCILPTISSSWMSWMTNFSPNLTELVYLKGSMATLTTSTVEG